MNDNTTAINIALEKIVLLNKEYKDYLGSCEQEAIDNIKNKNIFMPFYHVMHLCVTKLMNDENWRLIQKDVTARLYLSVTEFIEKNGLDNYGNIDWIKLFRNNYDQRVSLHHQYLLYSHGNIQSLFMKWTEILLVN
uniref:hypothetical protein n=1 Tax=Providencia sp. PROV265 TaxID=2949953 RepID=UPI00234A1AEF|nr:hypothetical protein [Providencia sp. PROV265]